MQLSLFLPFFLRKLLKIFSFHCDEIRMNQSSPLPAGFLSSENISLQSQAIVPFMVPAIYCRVKKFPMNF